MGPVLRGLDAYVRSWVCDTDTLYARLPAQNTLKRQCNYQGQKLNINKNGRAHTVRVSAPLTAQPSAQEGVALGTLEVPSDPATASAGCWCFLRKSGLRLCPISAGFRNQGNHQTGSP